MHSEILNSTLSLQNEDLFAYIQALMERIELHSLYRI